MDFTEKIATIGLLDATESLREEWRDLANSLGVNFSLHPDWTTITARSHGISENCRILPIYRGGRIVSVFPTVISQRQDLGLKLRMLDLVGNKVSYHNELVTRLEPEETIESLINVANFYGADVIHLANVADDSKLGTYLQADTQVHFLRSLAITGESSPYLPLSGTWDELLAKKPKKFRYKTRKRAKSLMSSENMRMQWYESEPDCTPLLSEMKVVEENSWKKTAGVSIFEKDHERQYHEMLLPFLASQNAMFANVLFLDDEPIAYNLCCVWDGWVGQMKTSFDTRYPELSPGSLVIDYAIQHAIHLNAKEFDFLGDADRHKLAWTKSVRSHTDYYLYLRSSLRGNIIGFLRSLRDKFRANPEPT